MSDQITKFHKYRESIGLVRKRPPNNLVNPSGGIWGFCL
jgi:hypothetical protein